MNWNNFVQMLKKLNPKITFHESSDNNHASVGVYIMEDDPNYIDTGDLSRPRRRAKFLFGASRDWVPERNEQAATGHIIRRGWKDAIVQMYEAGGVVNRDYYRELTRGWRPHPML